MKILVDHTIQYNNTQYYGHIEDILTMDYRHVMPVGVLGSGLSVLYLYQEVCPRQVYSTVQHKYNVLTIMMVCLVSVVLVWVVWARGCLNHSLTNFNHHA